MLNDGEDMLDPLFEIDVTPAKATEPESAKDDGSAHVRVETAFT
jgi:hypothetical protein